MNGPVSGNDVFIPMEMIIGGPQQCGNGWRMLMECLSIGRGISLPAVGVAGTQMAYRYTGAYAAIRRQFKVPVGKFEGVGEALAKIAGYNYLCESARILTLSAIDEGVKPAIASAIIKYHITELARGSINHAMDVHAGKGIQFGPSNYLGINYIGLPIAITVEGANILTRNLMIFGQGAIRCHPFIRKEIDALANKDVRAFDKLLFRHAGYTISNLARTLWHGLTCGAFITTPDIKGFERSMKKLTRMSVGLAFVSDLTMMLLGGNLKRKERLSARLGDVLSYLYLASAAAKYYCEHGQLKEEKPYLTWALDYCLENIKMAFYDFFDNFPNRFFGNVMKWLVFPWSCCYKKPTDKNEQQLATHMMEASALRDRLSNGCYIDKTGALPDRPCGGGI